MITRCHIHRWLLRTGVVIGAIGIAGYLFSCITTITHTWGGMVAGSGDRKIVIGRGGIDITWLGDDSTLIYKPGSIMMQPTSSTHWYWLPTAGARPDVMTPAVTVSYAVVPFWVLIAIGAFSAYRLLPAGYPPGRCDQCGYDLRGVPGSDGTQVCPECGAKGS